MTYNCPNILPMVARLPRILYAYILDEQSYVEACDLVCQPTIQLWIIAAILMIKIFTLCLLINHISPVNAMS
jgi:hypothetical protein